jgi:hypothetical protein
MDDLDLGKLEALVALMRRLGVKSNCLTAHLRLPKAPR